MFHSGTGLCNQVLMLKGNVKFSTVIAFQLFIGCLPLHQGFFSKILGLEGSYLHTRHTAAVPPAGEAALQLWWGAALSWFNQPPEPIKSHMKLVKPQKHLLHSSSFSLSLMALFNLFLLLFLFSSFPSYSLLLNFIWYIYFFNTQVVFTWVIPSVYFFLPSTPFISEPLPNKPAFSPGRIAV